MRHLLMKELLTDTEKNVTLYNSTSISWLSFSWTNGYYLHKVTSDEILRPYLISFKYYGTVDYEDEIMLLNQIADPFSLIPGAEIKIPKLDDLKKFILNNRK